MGAFIKNKMKEILDDFNSYIKDNKKYCELKDLRFDSNHTPDYNKACIQQYYLLKFLPAYLAEYYSMYCDIINENFIDNDYNILSIGCGCGIDYWASVFASRTNEESDISIRYTGLDVVNWAIWDNMDSKEVFFLKHDINEIEELDEEDYNIISFPKSIGELDNSTFEHLKEVIKNTNFNSDNIIIASSLRSTRTEFDQQRINEIL